jgi:hypothetical protein
LSTASCVPETITVLRAIWQRFWTRTVGVTATNAASSPSTCAFWAAAASGKPESGAELIGASGDNK